MSELATKVFEALTAGATEQLAGVLSAILAISFNPENGKPDSTFHAESGHRTNEKTKPTQSYQKAR